MSEWPMVPLGDVLAKSEDWIAIHPDHMYKEVTVRLWGNGATLRRDVLGAEIASPTRLQVHANQFIISRIDARNGASGLIPQDLEGAVVSNDFPVFTPDPTRLEPRFLGWLTKTKNFVELCKAASEGTTNRVRLKEDRFLAMTISLPALNEQRRLVERIDALATKIEEAKRLRRKTDEETVLLAARSLEEIRQRILGRTGRVVRLCEIAKVTAGGTPSRDNPAFWDGTIPWIKTGELLDGAISTAAEHITDAGVSGSSAKLFPIDTVLVALYGQGQTRGRTGRLLIPSTTNQACAAILPCDDLRPRYVQYWLRSLYREMREENHGGAQPNWNGQMIKDIKIAVPSLEEQDHIVDDCDTSTSNFERLGHLQENVNKELDAMLPAILNRAFRGEL